MKPFLAVMLAIAVVPATALPAEPAPRNVALGRPYTLTPAPNYPQTSDAGDPRQLTDGTLAAGVPWADKAAVGWLGSKLVTVTIDLGSPFEIRGASYGTAAGTADVEWPSTVLVLGSVDGRSYGVLGDLVALDAADGHAPPSTRGYQRHRFASRGLRGQARFVRFMIGATGPGLYVFSDEIEVFGEPAVTLRAPRDATTDTDALFWQARTAPRLREEVERRLHDARRRVSRSKAGPAERASLLGRLDGLEAQVAGLTAADWGKVNAEYPMNAPHAAAFEIIGAIEHRDGEPALGVWPANPWDALDMATPAPPAGPRAVDVALMNGEVRSTALNLRNATARPLVVTIDLGRVDALEPGFVEARPVAWTADVDGRPVALALLPPTPKPALTVLQLPAGVTRQVWLTFAPTRVPAGRQQRTVRVTSPGLPAVAVSANVRILPGRLPAAPSLHLGGFDYLHERGPVPRDAVDPVTALLRSFGFDLPWATGGAMPSGEYDQGGRLIRPPDTSTLDGWLARWPRAARYRVYVAARDVLAGLRRGTPAFDEAVRSWARFWAAHVTERGIDPGRVELLFVDEPHGPPELAERQIAWARALRASGTRFRVWIDPTYADPGGVPAELVGTADTVCLNRRLVEQSGDAHRRFATRLLAAGKAVELYATGGPASQLDPYANYRLMAWRAYDLGATAVSFWSVTDWGAGSSWREYQAPRVVYSPVFLDGSSVTPGKHLYAIREGVEDHGYLVLLRDAIASQGSRRPLDDPALAAARATLSAALARVLSASRPDAYRWSSVTDRSAADAARLEIAAALERLATPPPPGTQARPPAPPAR